MSGLIYLYIVIALLLIILHKFAKVKCTFIEYFLIFTPFNLFYLIGFICVFVYKIRKQNKTKEYKKHYSKMYKNHILN